MLRRPPRAGRSREGPGGAGALRKPRVPLQALPGAAAGRDSVRTPPFWKGGGGQRMGWGGTEPRLHRASLGPPAGAQLPPLQEGVGPSGQDCSAGRGQERELLGLRRAPQDPLLLAVVMPPPAPPPHPVLDPGSRFSGSWGPATSSSHSKFGEGSLVVGLGRGHGSRMLELTSLPLRKVHIRSPKYHHPENPQRAV